MAFFVTCRGGEEILTVQKSVLEQHDSIWRVASCLEGHVIPMSDQVCVALSFPD